jgi:Uma2 family endonuclease
MQPAARRSLTEAEYLAFEKIAPVRHEYLAGEAYAMAGGSLRHNRIALNTASLLLSRLSGRPCQVFLSDVKLYVAHDGAYYYPDVMAICASQAVAADESSIVTEPVLVVEVLSPATETTDRREKLAAYRRLPSLQEYALIAQDRQRVEIYGRRRDGDWLYSDYGPGDTVEFEGLGVTVHLTDLYVGTDIGA